MCQTNPVLLDVQANVENVIEKISYCKQKGANLIVFPELALTGYFVGLHYHKASLKMDSPQIRRIAAATKKTAAVVGFIEESQSMNFYNSALVAVDGEIKFAYRKLNLPNYGVFEERKFFASGKHIRTFRLPDLNRTYHFWGGSEIINPFGQPILSAKKSLNLLAISKGT